MSSGGSFGASPLTQHVGLGRVDRLVSVEVHWPASGTRQRFTGVEKNRTLRIREDGRDYTTVARAPLPLGGGSTRATTPR